MRVLPLECLRPGMVVARPIFDAEGRVLLNKGVILKPYYIQRLRELGIPAVYIADETGPEEEIADVVSEATRLKALKLVKETMEGVKGNRSAGKATLIEPQRVRQVVENIIEDLLSHKGIMVNLKDIRALDDYTFAHSVNVCIFAVITGITLKYPKASLLQLGMGALLHDIGKTLIPVEILNKPGPLTPEEYEIVCKHAQLGFEILNQQEGLGKLVPLVAGQHHERYNGSGYPCGLKGEAIHEFAAITAIVDEYDALTADRVYRKAYPAHEAYEMLAAAGNFKHDYRLVKAFLSNVAAYPVGTLVQLNTGEVGIVLETLPGNSHKPRVRLLYDREGRPLKVQPELNLAEEWERWIVKVVPPGDELK
ncbi:metal dependent phosphohydrolase [Thermanaeromonas toyohensis ToBE]|uniref:Metal dependent phosphohydrolase n=1 Tax=Thermanaeromonas toyohensis ToBE TaxID=698762 RepID=A0A1W1VBQ1_9FIRM|nr:HD-GYP domain-containing protein [Thermanaeromonas toyohensis]SMB90653.1 metal dependent phosphohydrolase [Thermanaeromonas toyohensis ToBE]